MKSSKFPLLFHYRLPLSKVPSAKLGYNPAKYCRKGTLCSFIIIFDFFFGHDFCKQETLLYKGLHLLPCTPYIFTLTATVQGVVKRPGNWKYVKMSLGFTLEARF